MLEDYNLHSAIAKTKCFLLTPPGNIPREEPPSGSHWVDELYRLCCEAMDTPPGETNPFQRHLNSDTVGMNSLVKEALFILLRRFNKVLDGPLGPLTSNEKTILAGMLMESVDACTNGFVNRALRAVSRLAQPKNLDEYLYRVRQALVETAVTGLLSGGIVNEGNEVHTWNRASIIAAREKLGIQANYPNDPHVGAIPDANLEVALQKTFERCFTPYELPVLLRNALLNEVVKVGYEGKKEEGYATGPISRTTHAVSQLLPELKLEPSEPRSWKKIFAWRPLRGEDEAMEELGLISFYELKLNFILGSIYQSLIGNGYLDPKQLQPRHLPDYAAHWKLCQQAGLRDSDLTDKVLDEASYVQRLFQEKQYGHLDAILHEHPAYWKHFIARLDITAITAGLTQFLRTALRIPQNQDAREPRWKKEIRHALLVLIALLSTADRYNAKTLKKLTRIFTEPSTRFHTYLSLALQYHPDLLPKILEAIDQHKQRWSGKTLRAMLFGVWPVEDWEGGDVDNLQQAIDCNNPQMLKEFLQFLKRHSTDDTENTRALKYLLKDLFLNSYPRYQDGNAEPPREYPNLFPSYVHSNLVEYAVYSEQVQAGTLQQLLDFVTHKPTIFNDAELNKLLNFDYNRLGFTLRRSASGSTKRKLLLDCLSLNEIRLSDGTIVVCLFPNAKQPSLSGTQGNWLSHQWKYLLNLAGNDVELANTLLLRISEYKPKLPEPIAKKIIAFVLERLSLFHLSDPKQKGLFERVLSNMGNTSPLFQGLLTSSTARNRGTANLPALLYILLPNHLEALKEESEILQQQSQLSSSPMRRISQTFAGLFRLPPDERLQRLNQEMGFTETWIQALTNPDHRDNIPSALRELKSNSGAARFLLEHRGWNALFEICYQQISGMPLPRPSPAPAAHR